MLWHGLMILQKAELAMDETLISFWQKQAEFAEQHNVKIAFEPYPGFCVYNAETMLKIRDACGKVIGCNLDPSHPSGKRTDPLKIVSKIKICHFPCACKRREN